MAKPFDATLKGMLEGSPADWLPVCGHRRNVVELIDADVSTYTGAADKVLRVGRKKPWILHLDFQSGHDPMLPVRLHL